MGVECVLIGAIWNDLDNENGLKNKSPTFRHAPEKCVVCNVCNVSGRCGISSLVLITATQAQQSQKRCMVSGILCLTILINVESMVGSDCALAL